MIKYLKQNTQIYKFLRLVIGLLRIFDLNFYNLYLARKSKVVSLRNKKKILLAGSVGINPDMLMQSIVGIGLKIEGSEVYQLSCDGVLPICYQAKHFHFKSSKDQMLLSKNGMETNCIACKLKSFAYGYSSGFQRLTYSKYATNSSISNRFLNSVDFKTAIKDPKYRSEKQYDGIAVLNHAYSAVVRFYASNKLEYEEFACTLFKSYCRSAIITLSVMKQVIKELGSVDTVICDHGIYIPQGIITEFCKLKKIKIITFNTGYRKNTFLFSTGDSYHFAIPRDTKFLKKKFSEQNRKQALLYVKSRKFGKNDWVYFQERTQQRSLQLSKNSKRIVLFPNVLWDADIHFQEALFKNSADWLNQSIRHIIKKTDFEAHIRIHPGEIKGFVKSRISALTIIDKEFLNNRRVKIYDAANPINSYELADYCELSVVEGSKIGIDLAALGKKVLVAGDCWTRNKGITCDPTNKADYFDALTNPQNIKLNNRKALDFAYYLYFEKMPEFQSIKQRSGDPPFAFNAKKFTNQSNDLNEIKKISI